VQLPRDATQRWSSVARRGDTTGMYAIYADDGVWLRPGSIPMLNRDSLRAHLAGSVEPPPSDSLVQPQETVRVRGDVTRLVQMLANLINNAAKYTPEGGRISIAARATDVEAEISVKDTGMGIAPEMLSRVFEMFVQGDQSQSFGGLGLGLTLVRKIAELHSGTVMVRSDGPGKGSEFVVRLPRLRVGPLRPQAESGRLDSREGGRDAKRVLIVDDNRDAADSLAMLLRLGHHEVLAVSSGQEALEAVRSFRPDLVLLDIGLPDLDGYEVARRLREAGYQSTLTALTGFGQAEDRERTRRAGFDHHLVKPVDPRTLQAMLT